MSQINGRSVENLDHCTWSFFLNKEGTEGIWVFNPTTRPTPEVWIKAHGPEMYGRQGMSNMYTPNYILKKGDMYWVENGDDPSAVDSLQMRVYGVPEKSEDQPGIGGKTFTAELDRAWQRIETELDSVTNKKELLVQKLVVTNHPMDLVKEFLIRSGKQLPCLDDIPMINIEVKKLIVSLIFEELLELIHAFNLPEMERHLIKLMSHATAQLDEMKVKNPINTFEKSVVEQLDALADIEYVLHNGTLLLGFKDHFIEGFEEIHGSNMSKFVDMLDNQQIDDTILYYAQKHGIEVTISEKGAVLREDNKILKSIDYWKPDLENVLWPLTVEYEDE